MKFHHILLRVLPIHACLLTLSVTLAGFSQSRAQTPAPANRFERNVVADPGRKFEFVDPDAHLFNQRFYRSFGP